MTNEYKKWLQDQTFETLVQDSYNTKLLLLAEQAKNKKLVEALELIMNNDDEPSFENYTATQALLANEVNK